MSEMFGLNAYSPQEIATRVESAGVAKARLPLLSLLMLGILAGAFIGLGAVFFVLVRSDPMLGFAAKQILGGLAFSLGLILVVVAGAELFTGNNLLVIARAHRRISTLDLLRNWTIVFAGNLIGAAGLALLVYLARHADMNDGAIAREYLAIAAAKTSLPFWTAFFRGVLCNALVCLAVWMAMAGRSVTDKVVAIIFPVSAFVAAGFEHSVANLYLFPLALLLQELGPLPAEHVITWAGVFKSMAAVVLGNIAGGSVLVGMVYYMIYIYADQGRDKTQDNLSARE
ncbi:formate/nitrite transporter family protein [Lacisediminimonas sp.]|uniref:formate/nitrite transporter family protein n=1 Tax=Lacisediminimonas sp. TaxID=3060582 RepID=UPI002720E2E1|nr:formate/nitrite transporter family protein [Lacisediminimonas sp.]MDO8298509.1 formate/nitrite transporter family protein [Lacisediminimonas sp.]